MFRFFIINAATTPIITTATTITTTYMNKGVPPVEVVVWEGDGEVYPAKEFPIANSGSLGLLSVIVRVCDVKSLDANSSTYELFSGIYL